MDNYKIVFRIVSSGARGPLEFLTYDEAVNYAMQTGYIRFSIEKEFVKNEN